MEDFGQYGLDNPACTIKLAAAERTYEAKLGDYSITFQENSAGNAVETS